MEKGGGQLVDAPSFVDLCTLHQHAMRYYRLWIYACNIVLAVASIIFTLVALSTFVDPRISLISGVELYQPTFLYGYVALFIQCGVLQAIGCIGALRLNQKLLTSYWTLLLVLMIGDILVGLVWAFRLDRIKTNLKPQLKQRLIFQYGNDSQFTQTWDWVQTNDMCCGADGPMDFLRLNDSSSFSNHFDSNGLPVASDGQHGLHYPKLPPSCCTFTVTQGFPFSTTPHPNSIPSSPLKGGGVPSPSSSSSGYPRHTSRTNNGHPHYFPNSNSNFTVHLSSFASSGTTHNRRKIIHGKGKIDPPIQGQAGVPPQSQGPSQGYHRPNVQTTTESSRRSNHFGICGLPPDLLDKYKSSVYVVKISDTIIDNFSNDGSGGSSSSEESSSSNNNNPGGPGVSSTPTTTTSSVLDLMSSVSPNSGASSPPPTPSHILVEMTLNDEGCGEKVLEWVDHASDVLFVIGFCIIVFVKGCFVAILRYEIKEMIQKIKLLNGDDEGRQAAMNELIGLTSMYEGGHDDEDPGEREGLMASAGGGVSGGGGVVANTNIDAIESDRRKDSVVSRGEHQGNCLVGNNIGHSRKMSVVNHVSSAPCNNPNRNCVVPGSSSHNKPLLSPLGPVEYNVHPLHHLHHQSDIDEDFDSGSALLEKPKGTGACVGGGGVGGCSSGSGGANKSSQHRNENGGRTLPRNGNNNTSGLGGVTGSASAPIPIDSMAKA